MSEQDPFPSSDVRFLRYGDGRVPDCSATLGDLAAALAAAQGEMAGAVKDSANPFFKSKYADLESVWEACRAPLAKHGLAVIQTTEDTDGGSIVLVTTLLHISGQWMRGRLRMIPAPRVVKDERGHTLPTPDPPPKPDPQSIVSAITYARRTALAAMVGVCPTDDDGEAASGRGKATASVEPLSYPEPRRARTIPPDAEAFEALVISNIQQEQAKHCADCRAGNHAREKHPHIDCWCDICHPVVDDHGPLITQKEIGSLMGAVERAGISAADLKAYCKETWGVTSRKELRRGHLARLGEWLTLTQAARPPKKEGVDI